MIELRDDGGFWRLSGHASTYNSSYFVADPKGTFRETIMPGAFVNISNPRSKIDLRVMHDWEGPVLASTATQTLRFQEGERALLTGAALDKTNAFCVATEKRIRSGELKSFSVGMVVMEDSWPQPDQRIVTGAYLREASLVDKPCNPDALVTDFRGERRSDTGALVEYRMVPIEWRDMDAGPRVAPEDEDQPCPQCGGTGMVGPDRRTCPRCGGVGTIEPDDDADDSQDFAAGARAASEGRRTFSDAERARLGAAGKAIRLANPNRWAFPTPTRADFDNAVHALGRASASDRPKVRAYLIRRAKAEGWPIPDSWGESREAVRERLTLDQVWTQREEDILLADLRGR